MRNTPFNPYKVLGVAPDATTDDITAGYERALSSIEETGEHALFRRASIAPRHSSQKDATDFTAGMKQQIEHGDWQRQLIEKAYKILSDPKKREQYDNSVRLRADSQPRPAWTETSREPEYVVIAQSQQSSGGLSVKLQKERGTEKWSFQIVDARDGFNNATVPITRLSGENWSLPKNSSMDKSVFYQFLTKILLQQLTAEETRQPNRDDDDAIGFAGITDNFVNAVSESLDNEDLFKQLLTSSNLTDLESHIEKAGEVHRQSVMEQTEVEKNTEEFDVVHTEAEYLPAEQARIDVALLINDLKTQIEKLEKTKTKQPEQDKYNVCQQMLTDLQNRNFEFTSKGAFLEKFPQAFKATGKSNTEKLCERYEQIAPTLKKPESTEPDRPEEMETRPRF